MIFLCFLWFVVLYFSAYKLGKDNDVFSPLKFLSLKYALTNLPFVLFIAFSPQSFVGKILRVCNITVTQAFVQYTLVQTIAFVSLVAGIMLFVKKSTLQKPEVKLYNYKNVKLLAVAFLLIGLAGYAVFLSRIGGLTYLLTNLDKRIELQSGQYILILLPFLIFSSLSFLLCIRLKNKILDKILFALIVITTLFVFSSFGARKGALLFVITLIVAAHFIINIKLNKKTLAVGVVLAFGLLFYVLIIPVLRLQKGEDGERAEFKIKNLAYQTTYAYIDVFAANYFTPKTAWYFKGFLDPVIVPFSKLEKSKLPQIDQGVYFNAIVENNKHYEPPMPRDQVSKTSWPTENFGFAYANLLLPGVILFFFLQGAVFSLAYRFFAQDSYNPVLIMLYVLVVFDFNFSSLRIAEFIRTIPIVIIAYTAFALFSEKSKVNSNL